MRGYKRSKTLANVHVLMLNQLLQITAYVEVYKMNLTATKSLHIITKDNRLIGLRALESSEAS